MITNVNKHLVFISDTVVTKPCICRAKNRKAVTKPDNCKTYLKTVQFAYQHNFYRKLKYYGCCLFRDESKALHQPVIKSVIAKLKTNVLYGVFSIDLFWKITISNRQLLVMASDPMIPNITLRPVVILGHLK